MKFEYERPFSFAIGPQPDVRISSIKHGVTEIALTDGRVVRATLHIDCVKNSDQPGALNVSYSVIAEVLANLSCQIADIHETLQ